jgi:prepilin-type N-terminal cleavage/methylation domain-containing protein
MRAVTSPSQGFTLIELMIVLAIFGTMLSFGLPAFGRYLQSQQLRGTSQNLVQTVQLQRTRAMSIGQTVTLSFDTGASPAWTIVGGGTTNRRGLPNGLRFASVSPTTLTITRDGRVNTSGLVVFENRLGRRDTVSIQVSGLALIR